MPAAKKIESGPLKKRNFRGQFAAEAVRRKAFIAHADVQEKERRRRKEGYVSPNDFDAALEKHARQRNLLSKKGGYEDTAREVGYVGVTAALVWGLLGCPGAPGVWSFLEHELIPHANSAFIMFLPTSTLWLFGVAGFVLEWISKPLQFPLNMILRTLRLCPLLTGVGAIGLVVFLPGQLIIHYLGVQ